MHLLAVGLSHKTAPLAVRERFMLCPDELPDAVAALRAAPGVREALMLSTCNRTEAYALVEEYGAGQASLAASLAAIGGASADELTPYIYHQIGWDDVALHLFRVAAGLDALVLGETQVLGQVKEAYRLACERETVGKVLHALCHRALEAAKRVHRETGVGRCTVSVSAAAVELAAGVFGQLAGRRALLVGAGETGELVAQALHENALAHVAVANRTAERAEALAQRYGGTAHGLEALDGLLREVDIVISSTGAPGYIVSQAAVAQAMAARGRRPLVLVDIAVPRDIDPAAGELEGVFLRNIDDLEGVVAANFRQRLREAQRAERLVAAEASRFAAWVETLDVVPVIGALRAKAEGIRAGELAKALRRLQDLGPRERAAVEALTVSLVNKLLNEPTQRLKALAAGPEGQLAAQALSDLFGLDLAAVAPLKDEPEPPRLVPPVEKIG